MEVKLNDYKHPIVGNYSFDRNDFGSNKKDVDGNPTELKAPEYQRNPIAALHYLAQRITQRLHHDFGARPNTTQQPRFTDTPSMNPIISQARNILSNNSSQPNSVNLADIQKSVQNTFQNTADELTNGTDDPTSILADLRKWFDQLSATLDRLRPAREEISVQQTSYQSENSTALQIETKEGDIVTIHINKTLSQQAAQLSYSNGSNTANGFALSTNIGTEFQISVEGNLNDEEQQHIKQLLSKIDEVAGQFHSGDDQALQTASELNIDGTSLKAFTLDLRSSEQTRAVDSYRSAAAANDDFSPDTNGKTSTVDQYLQNVKDFTQQIASIFDFAEKNSPFKNPHAALNDLFNLIFNPNAKVGKIEHIETEA